MDIYIEQIIQQVLMKYNRSMRNVLSILLHIFFSFTIFAQNELLTPDHCLILDVITSDNTILFYNKRKIPRDIKRIIKEKYDIRFKISNPNKLYNRTDVVTSPSLPNRQLLFGGKKDGYCFFVYKKGGRATSTYFVFFYEKSCDLNIYNVSNDIDKLDDLIQIILERKYYLIRI